MCATGRSKFDRLVERNSTDMLLRHLQPTSTVTGLYEKLNDLPVESLPMTILPIIELKSHTLITRLDSFSSEAATLKLLKTIKRRIMDWIFHAVLDFIWADLMISPQAGSMVFFLRDDFLVLICLPATTSDTRTYGAW